MNDFYRFKPDVSRSEYDDNYHGYVVSVDGALVAWLPKSYRNEKSAHKRASQLAQLLCEMWVIKPFELPEYPAHLNEAERENDPAYKSFFCRVKELER